MTINQVLSIFYPTLFAFFMGFLTYVGVQLKRYAPSIGEFIAAKVGFTRYAQIKAFGKDIWNIGEETLRLNPIIGDTIQAKITLFETAIRKKVPGITDAEIEELRQAIAGEFNKDKIPVIKTILNPIQESIVNVVPITPTIKYVTPEGVELQLVPKITPIADSTVIEDTSTVEATASTSASSILNPLD